MIANVSPSILSLEDTHNTLQYANRAKSIRTVVCVRMMTAYNIEGQEE